MTQSDHGILLNLTGDVHISNGCGIHEFVGRIQEKLPFKIYMKDDKIYVLEDDQHFTFKNRKGSFYIYKNEAKEKIMSFVPLNEDHKSAEPVKEKEVHNTTNGVIKIFVNGIQEESVPVYKSCSTILMISKNDLQMM